MRRGGRGPHAVPWLGLARPDPRSQPGSAPARWARPQAFLWLPPQQLDPENTGFVGADTFAGLVHNHELPLDPAKLDMLVALAQSNERGQVCYQELVDLVSATVGGQHGWRGWAWAASAWPEPGGKVAFGWGLGGPRMWAGQGRCGPR